MRLFSISAKRFFELLILLALFPATLSAQSLLERRPLDHKDYDAWQTISGKGISRDGNWVWYSIQSGAIDGDPKLTIRNLKSGKEFSIERGNQTQFSFDSRFAMYRISPSKKKLKELRKKKTKSEDLPKAVFQILELDSGELTTIENVASFKMPEENGQWLAVLLDDPQADAKVVSKKSAIVETYEVTQEGLRRPEKKTKLKSRSELEPQPEESNKKADKKKEKKSEDEDDKDKKKDKKAGQPLLLINLETGMRRTFPSVTNFVFSKYGDRLAFITSVKAEPKKGSGKSASKESNKENVDAKSEADEDDDYDEVDGVYLVRLSNLQTTRLIEGEGNYRGLTFTEKGNQLAFATNRDDYESETPAWSLYHWNPRSKVAKKIAAEGDKGIPIGWWIATQSSQTFSKDGKRLYFETAPIPEAVSKERKRAANGKKAAEDEDDNPVKLDIWHWQDPQLQPQQLMEASIEKNRDYRAVYNIRTKKIHQLATREIPSVPINLKSPSKVAIANTNMAYRKMLSWDIPGFQDAWIVNLENGDRQRLLEKVKFPASLSPTGTYAVWFDAEQKHWFAKPAADPNSKPVKISKGIKHALQNELHDTPNLPRSYGSPGWTSEEHLLVYDRFDIWSLDPTGDKKPVCLTRGKGRKTNIAFRYQKLDDEEQTIDLKQPIMLSAFDRTSKASGYYQLSPSGDEQAEPSPKRLIMLDESVGRLQKAQEGDAVLFTRNTFRMSPDLWSSDVKFKKISRVSDANPQQDEFTWGTAELVSWKAEDGQELDGILYKPDGFDPKTKHPLMVYFYERNSDNLHRYHTPAAGRSTINFSFYVSRGYVVFVPDIPYKTGEPGPSAANAILPGVESLIEQGFVDKDRIGMQGHSWGGYQTAYLVTQTDMFACAESGAPVSNMTSAYGGIRWSSGRSRMFQYERTQSRIGDTLWSARDKYIANSPVFFADKVNTPLLILHNDEDGAVPWYQGIELFVALRRLEKPAWMLNYNGNPHWVMGDHNRRDFAIRMQQFFDHYLKEAPEPEWMAVGVPAVKKGKEMGLSLLEPEGVEPEKETEPEQKAESKKENIKKKKNKKKRAKPKKEPESKPVSEN